jgi:hypothetical protein
MGVKLGFSVWVKNRLRVLEKGYSGKNVDLRGRRQHEVRENWIMRSFIITLHQILLEYSDQEGLNSCVTLVA